MAYSVYEPEGGPLHRIDPAAKMAAIACWFVVALLLSRPAALAALGVFVIGCALAARLGRSLLRFWKFMAILFVMSAGLWAIFSRESGLWRGAWMGLRLTTMLAMGLVFLGATRVEEIAAGMQRMGVPFTMAFSLTLAFRLLPLFAGSGSIIVQAQACRGLDLREGGLMTRLRRYLPLLVPLVLSGLRTADALAAGLESRGLGMKPSRTSVIESRAGLAGTALVVSSLAAVAGAFWLRRAGLA